MQGAPQHTLVADLSLQATHSIASGNTRRTRGSAMPTLNGSYYPAENATLSGSVPGSPPEVGRCPTLLNWSAARTEDSRPRRESVVDPFMRHYTSSVEAR